MCHLPSSSQEVQRDRQCEAPEKTLSTLSHHQDAFLPVPGLAGPRAERKLRPEG